MNTNNEKVQVHIESAFALAIKKLENSSFAGQISDLYVQIDTETGELQIYDDGENLVEKVTIFNWINRNDTETSSHNKATVVALKQVLTKLSVAGAFGHDCFMRPFSVCLTDELFTVIDELLFLDDDMLRLDDPLLKDLDADLDEFLKKLLS